MKKEELSTKATYIECPDKNCNFWENDKINCQYDCPQRDKFVKLVKCFLCGEIIRLPITHSKMYRVEHKCPDGNTPFILESGTIVITRNYIK